MNAFQVIDALVASFFGLIGIWTAVVVRHWFLRFVVASVFLLSTLLITAHEIAIEFGIQIALLMVGVWFARDRKHWQFKFTVESALLAMVVVAVVSAVIGKADDLSWWTWHFMVSTGVCTAGFGLSALWLTFGKARLRYRIPGTLLSVAIVLGFYHFAEGTRHAIAAHLDGGDWQVRLAQHYEGSNVGRWLSRNAPTVLLGAVIICTALLTARDSGWFSGPSTSKPNERIRLRMLLARIGLIAILLGITSPLLYIFYRLMTPAQFPVVEIREPNGYDDIVAAGKLIDDDVYQIRQSGYRSLSNDALNIARDALATPLQRLTVAANQPNLQIPRHGKSPEQTEADSAAIEKAAIALLIEYFYIERFGTTEEIISWALKTYRLEALLDDGWETSWPTSENAWLLRRLMNKLESSTCRELAKNLHEHDCQRRTLKEYLLPFRVQAENRGWERHYQTIVRKWPNDPYQSYRNQYQRQIASFRMLIAQLALQSYFLDNNQLPQTLAELVPEHLPAIPLNPKTRKPIEYQPHWGGYALVATVDYQSGEKTLIVTGPAAPYLWQRLQESWHEFRQLVAALQRNARRSGK